MHFPLTMLVKHQAYLWQACDINLCSTFYNVKKYMFTIQSDDSDFYYVMESCKS